MSKYGKRAVGLLLTGALCAGLLAGCGGAPEAAVTPTAPSESGSASGRRVETLRLEGGPAWGVPNPYLHQSRGPGTAKMRLVYGSLLEKDETGDVPWLAERWSMDGNDYTFTLFADAQFQDGAPLTTADVAFTLDYYQEHPPVSNSLGVGDSYLVDHYTVVDEQTITITVKEANADTLSNLGSFVILPKHIWENVDDPNSYTGEGYLTGSGAYACTAYDGATGSYEFTAFDGWCNGEQAAEKIQFVPVSDPLLAFESGEIDITSLPADLMDTYLNDPSIGVVEKANDMGYDRFNVGPEAEFFLFKTDEEGKPTTQTNDEAGYFDLGPLDHGESTRREICMALEQMDFEIEASHHECAQGQHEIDFKYAEALHAADNIMTFKLAVKTLAQRNGLHATFMPKPIFGIAGSGMHTNMSLFRNGKNAFYDPDDPRGLSKEAYSFIAGLLHHVRGMAAVTNPLVNSYKRLVPGYEAPCYLAWSASNRSALIRIPAARGQSTRVELRSPDPACNPYLELAVCLAAGLDGIEKGLTPPPEVTENIFDMNAAARKAHGIDSLPDSLEEAIHALEADPLVLDTLGEHVAANYIEGKRKEWEEYRTRVSSWEREKYIINY